ncbi:hypothetical protein [Pontitalea aquivivens]|uniref:hypothetical protein n=1 Tax=Pontitalea aquivivens TaxID=3388663 RepID=UPI003970A73B
MRHHLLATLLSITCLFPGAGGAQQALFDPGAISAGCAAGNCVGAVRASVTALQAQGLTAAAMNSQLAILAATLVQAAQTAPAATAADYATALEAVAAASTDPAQARAIASVAQAVGAGKAATIDLTTGIAASAG